MQRRVTPKRTELRNAMTASMSGGFGRFTPARDAVVEASVLIPLNHSLPGRRIPLDFRILI